MSWNKIIEKEEQNFYKIYLYINEENNMCYSYEFSAYLLAQLLNIKLEETKKKVGANLFYTQLSIQAVVEGLSGPNTLVDNDSITVVLDDPSRCSQWKMEFNDLKRAQRKFHNKFIGNMRRIFNS